MIKSAVALGYGYLAGDVVEVSDKVGKELLEKKYGKAASEIEAAISKKVETREKAVKKK